MEKSEKEVLFVEENIYNTNERESWDHILEENQSQRHA